MHSSVDAVYSSLGVQNPTNEIVYPSVDVVYPSLGVHYPKFGVPNLVVEVHYLKLGIKNLVSGVKNLVRGVENLVSGVVTSMALVFWTPIVPKKASLRLRGKFKTCLTSSKSVKESEEQKFRTNG